MTRNPEGLRQGVAQNPEDSQGQRVEQKKNWPVEIEVSDECIEVHGNTFKAISVDGEIQVLRVDWNYSPEPIGGLYQRSIEGGVSVAELHQDEETQFTIILLRQVPNTLPSILVNNRQFHLALCSNADGYMFLPAGQNFEFDPDAGCYL